jgi:hypothetical protein
LANSFLKPENLKKLYTASETFMDDVRRPFDEFERIKNNHPHPNIDPAYPRTTDGTTAAQVRLTPRRAIQQIPYGEADVAGEPALSCLADQLLREVIVPNSTTQDGILGKLWKGVEDIETYGSTDAIVFYKAEGDYFGTDWRIPNKKDVYLEAGKGTYSECNYFFIRAYYQDSDIQSIIDKEESLVKSAKKRGEKYSPSWDVKALQELLKEGDKAEKDQKNKTDTEKDLNIKTEGYQFIHAYQKGRKAKFYTFMLKGDEGSVLRTWENPDPRGVMPKPRMYFESDLSNPEGRGIVELVAPLQNYLDSCLQAQQYVKALMYNPPLLKKGNFNRSQIKYAPNAIIDLGTAEGNSLTPLNLTNAALNNFSADYGLIKSQILNLFGGDDQSVSSTVGNPGFSKTDAGVNARQAIIGVNDNFIRKRVEGWISEIWCTQLNVFFQVTQGDREFALSDEAMEKLASYETEYYTLVDGKVIVHFSMIQDKEFKFEVEASTTKAPDTNESKEHFLEAMKTVAEIGLGQYVDPNEATKRIFVNAGVDDSEKLIIDPQQMQDPMADPNADPMADQEGQQVIQNLINAGYPPEVAQGAYQMEMQGYQPEQIDEWVRQQVGAQ